MAKKQQIQSYKQYLPINEKMRKWGEETVELIRRNFETQKVHPKGEVYPGFDEKNKRADWGWRSTGAGYDSIQFELLKAAEGDLLKLQALEAAIRYRHYLNFVDLGVLKGVKAKDVQRSAPLDYRQRYIKEWNPSKGQTHRPIISAEIRHQVRRLSKYLSHRYANEVQVFMWEQFEGMDASIMGGSND